MKILLGLVAFILTACSGGGNPIIGALAVNAHTCHLPPVVVVTYADGTHRTYEKGDITPDLLAQIHKLPESHLATVMVPCGDEDDDSPASDPPHKHAKVACGSEDWAKNNQELWADTHCSNIRYQHVQWIGLPIPDPAHDVPPTHTGLPKREVGIDAQGHLPPWLTAQEAKNLCRGHVQEVLTEPSGALLIVCRAAKLIPGQ